MLPSLQMGRGPSGGRGPRLYRHAVVRGQTPLDVVTRCRNPDGCNSSRGATVSSVRNRPAETACSVWPAEPADRVHMGPLRRRRQFADGHVRGHAPARSAHLGHRGGLLSSGLHFPSRSPLGRSLPSDRSPHSRNSGFVRSRPRLCARCSSPRPGTIPARPAGSFTGCSWPDGSRCWGCCRADPGPSAAAGSSSPAVPPSARR